MMNVLGKAKALLHNKTLANGALFSLFSFFSRGVAFVLLILLANYISPADYGQLSLYSTIAVFLGYFVDLGVRGFLSVSYFRSSAEGFKKDFTSICTITLGATLAIATLFALLSGFIPQTLHLPAHLAFVAVMSAFCTVFIQLNLDYVRVQEKVSLYGLLSCSYALLNLLLSLYLVIGHDMNWRGRVYAQAGCDLLFLLVALFWFFKDHLVVSEVEWGRVKGILLWGLPLIPHAASNWVRQGLDRYIINSAYSLQEVGLFSFALNLTSVIIMIGFAFNATNSVDLFKTLSAEGVDEAGRRRSLLRKERRFLLLYLVAAVAVVVAVLAAVPFLLPTYVAALPYFVVLAAYGFFQCCYLVYCNYLFYFKQTKNLMYVTFGTSLAHFLLSFALSRYSLFFTAGIYVLSFASIAWLVKRMARKAYPV